MLFLRVCELLRVRDEPSLRGVGGILRRCGLLGVAKDTPSSIALGVCKFDMTCSSPISARYPVTFLLPNSRLSTLPPPRRDFAYSQRPAESMQREQRGFFASHFWCRVRQRRHAREERVTIGFLVVDIL